jgi:hypothetical protein
MPPRCFSTSSGRSVNPSSAAAGAAGYFYWLYRLLAVAFRRLARTRHAACSLPHEELTMTLMTSTFFYDRKIRIAILTLATFAALC